MDNKRRISYIFKNWTLYVLGFFFFYPAFVLLLSDVLTARTKTPEQRHQNKAMSLSGVFTLFISTSVVMRGPFSWQHYDVTTSTM